MGQSLHMVRQVLERRLQLLEALKDMSIGVSYQDQSPWSLVKLQSAAITNTWCAAHLNV